MLISRKAICSIDRGLQSRDAAREHGVSPVLLLQPAFTHRAVQPSESMLFNSQVWIVLPSEGEG